MKEVHGSESRMTRSVAKRRMPLVDVTNTNADAIRLHKASSSAFRGEEGSTISGDWISPSTPVPNSAEDGNRGDKLEMSIIYTRGKRRMKKVKKIPPTASCPLARRSTSGKRKEILDDLQSKTCSVPYQNGKKGKKFTLPQDFIKKQNAYFAEIDAHELLIEEVSESDVE